MMHRGRRTPLNDGLPVVQGKKVKRRPRQSLRSFSHHSSVAGSSWSLSSYLWRFALFAVIIFTVILNYDDIVAQTKTLSSSFPKATPPAPKPAKTVPSPPPKARPTPLAPKPQEGFPAKCTKEQLKKQLAQLPVDPDGLGKRSWRDASFTLATKRSGGVYNPELVREFFASDEFTLDATHAFYGVSIGWQNKNVIPVDMLLLGSRDPSRYDRKKWSQEIGLGGEIPLTEVAIKDGASKRPAKYLMVGVPEDLDVKTFKDNLKYSDQEFAVKRADSIVALGDVINNNRPSVDGKVADDQPIHYLEINSPEEQDAYILAALGHNMDKVRFVHFQYNKGGSWFNGKLSSVISDLRASGHVCYFASQTGSYDLWRITDCFLDHFDENHWAGISCINFNNQDVRVLAERMEKKFLETLEKDQSFLVKSSMNFRR